MSAASIARALGGHRCGGGFVVRCPVPGHGKGEGDGHPSLSIRDGDERLLVKCMAGCDPRDVLDHLRRLGLLHDDADRADRRDHDVTAGRDRVVSEPEPDPEALALWHAGEPIGGTLGDRYLREHRGLTIEPPPSLRFHPDVVYPRAGQRFPAMIAAVQRPDRKVVAVQATYLRPRDGAKAPLSAPRWTFGTLGSGAVRLAAAGDVLGLAEGTETALSAMSMSGIPAWATLGGERLGKVTIPAGVREVHLFADNDEPGRLAAERAAGRYTEAGRRVVLRFPPDGFKDWNDVLRARTRRAAA